MAARLRSVCVGGCVVLAADSGRRAAAGVRQFLALNRKFDVAFAGRDDLIPLTYEARDLLRGTYLK